MRFLIYGYGDVVQNRMKKALEKLGIELAIVEVDEAKINRARREGITAYRYGEEDPYIRQFDAVVIATPPDRHFEPFKKAVAHGVPVMVEKPLAHDLETSMKMRDLAEETNLTCMAIDHYVFKPPVRYVVENLSEFEHILRSLKSVRIRLLDHREPKGRRWLFYSNRGGSIIWEFMVHAFAVLHRVLSKVMPKVVLKPLSCSAYRIAGQEGDADQYAEATLLLNDKTPISIKAGREEKFVEFVSDEGTLKIDFVEGTIEVNGITRTRFPEDDSYEAVFNYFKEVLESKRELEFMLNWAVELLEIADEARRAAREIRSVPSKEIEKLAKESRADPVFHLPHKTRNGEN